ncbi:MAG: lipoyl synthase [Bacteroidales bacterium]|nr:lipoyl synthase [Bacteroidales bacterium]
MEEGRTRRRRLPDWMRMEMPRGETYSRVKNLVQKNHLHTICTSGKCPNIGECWNAGTATFMILGDICTRACKFCNVKTGRPLSPDPEEPRRLAESVKLMGIRHCVITSVDRDDLPDLGASFWAETIRTVKKINPEVTIETLIPDFQGREALLQQVIDAGPEVISHNVETVRRLTPEVRNKNIYDRSLKVLQYISSRGVITKSGIMLGLGETREEVLETMDDLLDAGCQVMTIGQYLQPSPRHYPVKEYVRPGTFSGYKTIGLDKGFQFVESSPLVRSSYHAEKHIHAVVTVNGRS